MCLLLAEDFLAGATLLYGPEVTLMPYSRLERRCCMDKSIIRMSITWVATNQRVLLLSDYDEQQCSSVGNYCISAGCREYMRVNAVRVSHNIISTMRKHDETTLLFHDAFVALLATHRSSIPHVSRPHTFVQIKFCERDCTLQSMIDSSRSFKWCDQKVFCT